MGTGILGQILADFIGKQFDLPPNAAATVDGLRDDPNGVNHGGVVAVEGFPDIVQAFAGQFPGQIHGNVPWKGNGTLAGFGEKIVNWGVELSGDIVPDIFGRKQSLFSAHDIADNFPDQFYGGLAPHNAHPGLNTNDGAFHPPDIALDVFR